MATPEGSVTLTQQQIDELAKRLADMRHDVNNNLSLIVAAAELIKFNPAAATRMADTMAGQPPKIVAHMTKFSTEFEKVLGIVR
jgi:Zn-dependent oligopeptidase